MKKLKKINYSKKELSKFIPHPKTDVNKYSRGTCICVAGSKKFPGAAVLTAKAAQRSGAGYTKLYTFKDNVNFIAPHIPSCVVGSIDDLIVNDELDTNKPQCFVVGPGFNAQDSWCSDAVVDVLSNTKWPVVLDGGALSTFKCPEVNQAIEDRNKNNAPTIITPHTGEAKSILTYLCEDDITSPKDMASKLVCLTNCIVVLKGPNTFICDDKKLYLMKKGSSALAKAGSGDVLAGIIGGILCQNTISAYSACALAANLHAISGNLCAKNLNDISVLPEDIIEGIPQAFNTF